MKCNASLGRTRFTGHYGENKLSMTEILFGTPNLKTKRSLGLLLKISTENPVYTSNFKVRYYFPLPRGGKKISFSSPANKNYKLQQAPLFELL